MKHLVFFSSLILLISFSSCKNDDSKTENKTPQKTDIKKDAFVKTGKRVYTLIADSTKINWVAYKTSDKKPVGGSFNIVNVKNTHPGNNITEALDGLTFSIPVSSVFTNNSERDQKLKDSFFGQMISSEYITGVVVAKNYRTAYVNLTMNGITTKLPVSYKNMGTIVTMNTTMDLKNWKTEAAVSALNIACGVLHKGKDGVSKTWDEVEISINGKFLIK